MKKILLALIFTVAFANVAAAGRYSGRSYNHSYSPPVVHNHTTIIQQHDSGPGLGTGLFLGYVMGHSSNNNQQPQTIIVQPQQPVQPAQVVERVKVKEDDSPSYGLRFLGFLAFLAVIVAIVHSRKKD